MTGEPETIRSYQRIFTPDRRLYSIEGHPIPVPGGVPLRWLGYASSTFVAVLVLGAQSPALVVVGAILASLAGCGIGGWGAGLAAAVGGAVCVWAGGFLLDVLDWPIRLVVVPAAVATLATQATPDGRRAHRFAASWLMLRLAPRRQSMGRPLPAEPDAETGAGWFLWVAPDHHRPRLTAGIVRGPAEVRFSEPVEARRRGRRAVRVSCLGWRARRGGVVRKLTVAAGERVEVRP